MEFKRIWIWKSTEGQTAKVLVRIKRDSYDDQSYGKVSYWNGQEWSEVHDVPIQFLKCASCSKYDAQEPSFEEDCALLTRIALEVVF